MMQLLDYFSELSIYPENAKKLRQLVLQLAVRGKLTASWRARHPELVTGSNSAAALLEKIKAEKAQLIQKSKIKIDRPVSPIEKGKIPHSIPNEWLWCKLGNIGSIIGGGTPQSNKPEYFSENGIPWLTPADLGGYRHKYISKGKRDISELGLLKSSAQVLPTGSVLFSSRAPIGHIAIASNPISTNQGFKSCVPFIPSLNEYIYYYLKAITKRIEERATGTTFKEVSGKEVTNIYFSLPPLEEQKAIVAKVDALMVEIDALEQLSVKRIERKNKFVASALHHISTTAPEAMNGHWDLLKSHFHDTMDEVTNVKKLRETILQLAVQGKLTRQFREQNPDLISGSNSATALLEQIKAEKARLIQEGKIKKENPLPPIKPSEIPYELPEGWVWCRMQDICPNISSGSTPPKQFFVDEGVPYLKVYNIRNQQIDFSFKEQFIDTVYHKSKLKRSVLEPGDVIMNIVGPPLGKIAIIPDTYPEWNCNQAITFFKPVLKEINLWLYTHLCAGIFLKVIELIGTAGQDNISVTKSKSIIVPIPSLAEQKAIVEKVNELMSLCDQMEQHITDSQHLAEDLMKSLVREVVQ